MRLPGSPAGKKVCCDVELLGRRVWGSGQGLPRVFERLAQLPAFGAEGEGLLQSKSSALGVG